MDVNNTRYHLLLGRRDWESLLPEVAATSDDEPACGLVWNAERNSVMLRPLLYRFRKPESLQFGQRRGAAMDAYGNWYAIGPDERHITLLPRGALVPERLWPLDEPSCEPAAGYSGDFDAIEPEPAPESMLLRGMAATTHHYLVVGSVQPPGLLIFDLHGGGAPMWLPWNVEGAAPEAAFAPFDLAPRPEGGVWILDFDPTQDNTAGPRYWALDRYFRIEAPPNLHQNGGPSQSVDFFPVEGGLGASPTVKRDPAVISEDLAFEIDLERPVAIEGLPDDTVLVLDAQRDLGETRIARFAFGEPVGGVIAIREMLQAEIAHGIDEKSGDLGSWQGYDFAFVPALPLQPRRADGTLYVVGSDGNQAFSFTVTADDDSLALDLNDRYLPLRRFGGKALVAARQTVYYDLEERWVRLAAQPKPRYCQEASLETGLFDGRIPDCVWHRLFLEGCIPAGSSVRVQSRAANDPNLLQFLSWDDEPRPYLRSTGPELPFAQTYSDDELRREGTGTWELAFQRARGRFLQLRLTFVGTGRSTPQVHALRIYYPRFSYLREYLPDVYQEDETSASFLDRFLANVEGTFTELEGRIAEAQRLFDERTVDAAYLDWLASWFGVLLEPTFSEAKRRLFIRHAIELFNQRGTLPGLLRILRLTLDPCPDESIFQQGACGCDDRTVNRFGVRVVEQFLTRSLPAVVYGDPTDVPRPLLTTADARWSPSQGAGPLHEGYRKFLEERYGGSESALQAAWDKELTFESVRLSPVPPAEEGPRADWRLFVGNSLGFRYAEVGPEDGERYRTFLRRRYGSIKRLEDAYSRTYGSFSAVGLPAEDDFPKQNPRLRDWIQFVSLALPIERNSHRFTVLVPVAPGTSISEQLRSMELVRRIVDREKPAHTEFDVKPFWALFLVGTARLGIDTLLGEGSRFVALILGQGYLGGAYLERAHPGDVADRLVLGRDHPGVAL